MKTRGHFIVKGVVQGVCFRMYTLEEGARLGLTGWVKNRDDGTVEVVAEGEEEAVGKLRDWCHRGPPHARVTDVTESYAEPSGSFDAFRISVQ
jgi:acylphosphatase